MLDFINGRDTVHVERTVGLGYVTCGLVNEKRYEGTDKEEWLIQFAQDEIKWYNKWLCRIISPDKVGEWAGLVYEKD